MSARVSGDLASAFSRRVQQGELPDQEGSPQLHGSRGGYRDLLVCTNRHGDTPLLVAARHGHVSVLTKLIETHRVPVEHTNRDGKTALHEAAQNGQVAAINYLIKAGARIDCLKRADWLVMNNY